MAEAGSSQVKVFISSVQKEFEEERRALKNYLTCDPLLGRFITDVFIFEDAPASGLDPAQTYLSEVAGCDVYIALLGKKYGYRGQDGKSPTELEFDRATETGRERLIFVQGEADAGREPEMARLIRKAEQQVTRRRFTDSADLIRKTYDSLVNVLERRGDLRLTPFDGSVCQGATLKDIDAGRVAAFVERAESSGRLVLRGSRSAKAVLANFNLLRDGLPTNAAILLFGKNPSRFLANAQVHCLHFFGVEKRKPIASQ
jgi:hypothetical protein